LRDLAFKARQRQIVFDGVRTQRLVPGTAADGLVMSVPPAADLPQPLNASLGARTVAVGIRGAEQGSGSVELSFFERPISPP
jgi:hypothetical protein